MPTSGAATTRVSSGLPGTSVQTIAVDLQTTSILYVGTSTGLGLMHVLVVRQLAACHRHRIDFVAGSQA